jgi:hypothetical protein
MFVCCQFRGDERLARVATISAILSTPLLFSLSVIVAVSCVLSTSRVQRFSFLAFFHFHVPVRRPAGIVQVDTIRFCKRRICTEWLLARPTLPVVLEWARKDEKNKSDDINKANPKSSKIGRNRLKIGQ